MKFKMFAIFVLAISSLSAFALAPADCCKSGAACCGSSCCGSGCCQSGSGCCPGDCCDKK